MHCFSSINSGNPTRNCLEEALASSENAKYGLAFSSGLAATTSILHSFLKSGDHVVSGQDCYGGTGRLLRIFAESFSIQVTYVDSTSTEAVKAAVRPDKTKLVMLESPTNPSLHLTDIKAVSEAVKLIAPDAVYCIDNTFMSPYLQQPLDLGADLSMHSLSKYVNGHSDVIMGAVMTNNDTMYHRLKFMQNALGGVPSPMDCFLVNRGLKTLHLRMQRHSQNAMEVASFLEKHAKVSRVLYPGLKSHPQHELARRQTPRGFSGMISFNVKSDDMKAASKVVSKCHVFKLAESLGGVESLCEIPFIMTHASHPPEVPKHLNIDETLIRISVGIEHARDLIQDLEQALSLS